MKKVLSRLLASLLIILTTTSAVYAQDYRTEDTGGAAQVILNDNGKTTIFNTTAATVMEFLDEARIHVEDCDIVTPGLYEAITDDMKITIERGYQIVFMVYDRAFFYKKYYNIGPGRQVSAAVREYEDFTGCEFAYDLDLWAREVTPGMVINLNQVTDVQLCTNEELPYETEYFNTDQLPQGSTFVINEGAPGTVFVVEDVRYEGTLEIKHTRISEEVTLPAVNRVIAVGTGPSYLSMPTGYSPEIGFLYDQENPVHKNNDGYVNLYQDLYTNGGSVVVIPEESDDTAYVAASGDSYNIPMIDVQAAQPLSSFNSDNILVVNGIYVEYNKEFVMSATAYTNDYASTGKKPGDKYYGMTASGLKAQVGVVAVDPNVIPLFTKLYIEGYGFAIAGDTGKSVKGEIIDLYLDSSGEVKQFGRQKRKVYILTDQEFEIALQK